MLPARYFLKRMVLARGFFGIFKTQKKDNSKGSDSTKMGQQRQSKIQFQGYEHLQRKIENQARERRGEAVNLPDQLGKGGIQEIYYFAVNVEKIPDIAKCIQALIICPQQGTMKDSRFQVLYFKILQSIIVLPKESILSLYSFGMRYKIDSEEYWRKAQKRSKQMLPLSTNAQLIMIIECMSKVKDSYSQVHLNLIEKILEDRSLQLDDFMDIANWLRNGRIGSKEFIQHCIENIKKKIDHLQALHLVRLAKLCRESKVAEQTIRFQTIESTVLSKGLLQKMPPIQVAQFASCLQYQQGSSAFNRCLTQKLLNELNWQQHCQTLVMALISNYKLPASQFQPISPLLQSQSQSLSLQALCSIQKYAFMSQRKKVPDLQAELLKRLDKDITNEELYQVTMCYHLTRQGKRSTYIRLEEEMRKRIGQILLDVQLADRFHTILQQSNLCTAELLIMFQEHTYK